ncbi:asparaginase [Streptomyces lavendulae]|uniref:asparaginase n=1 Tax=Streptomyces lavendulae TaxID=1914 RepID=UPI0024A00339|nr:asparaginase [Streptomyces lavendulae]GLX22534.1 L-asparaginase [Streptomyces lavendulae subsp. lavendulae]GLX30017.1 L-asparaginase [Streptomyces lavendulae subsp. lavendulae]
MSLAEQHHSVLVLALGGTIAMTPTSSAAGVAPTLSGSDLVAAVPGLGGFEVSTEDFRKLPGASLAISDIVDLVHRLEQADREGVDGIVVTQGTDTLDETAFLTDLYYRGSAPVVFTGAMRSATAAGADGPANILAAVQAATGGGLRGAGVFVVMGDEIHAARYVRKMHTTSPAAFTSPAAGPVGHLVEGAVRLRHPLKRTAPVALPLTPALVAAEVEVVTASLGSSGILLEGLEGKIAGLVVAAFGVGHVPQTWVSRLASLAEAMPVVLASRIGTGPVLTSTYAFPGSESDLLARGLIAAGALDPYKARLVLAALLAAGTPREAIAKAFLDYA